MARAEYKEQIEVRKGLDFDLNSDEIPKYWLAGQPFQSRLVDAVQATFPDGERYFIASVNAFRKKVDDPVLLQEMKGFSEQEGQHGRVHTDFNNRLARQGININAFTGYTKKMTNSRLRNFSPEYNVALTAALEHFTAMMADLFFAKKYVLEGADPRVKALLAWHAVEEMEHKAVAFDVMQKVAKVGYFRRCLAMTHAAFSFGLFTLIAPWFILRMDGFNKRQRVAQYSQGLVWMFGLRRGVFLSMLPSIAKYYRPGFHPNDLPSVHNYKVWLQSFELTQNPMQAAEAMHGAAL